MSNIFQIKSISKKKKKVNYFSPKVWRLTYLISLNSVYHNSEKRIYTRTSSVPITFSGYEVVIHNGMRWSNKRINQWTIGYKFGSFTWNRKYAIYKAKSKKKKKK
jgi:ribosomal protein S19